MSHKITPYLRVEKTRLFPLRGDPAAMLWYGALLDYAKRFRADRHGFTRISRKVIFDDYGFERRLVQTLNAKLEAAGMIYLDKKHRGGRTPTGYKIV